MNKKKRALFAVLTATPEKKEQRDILSGILAQAQKCGIDIVVLSNIYNPSDTADVLERENAIYDLIRSEEFDGFILLSESMVNPDVSEKIRLLLCENLRPVISVGATLTELDLPRFFHINTDDVLDFEIITNHLLEQHGFTDIAFLSGPAFREVSHRRIAGYRKALTAHGIAFDEKKVHFGNFWVNSGEALAADYCNGRFPLPQAIICANDYMAYGLLDAFKQNGIDVPAQVAVVGYEDVQERLLHAPLLTTFARNRQALGKAAVELLAQKKETDRWGEWTAPCGTLVPGSSCGCKASAGSAQAEMQMLRQKNMYDFVSLYNQLDHRLTECVTLSDFTAVCHTFAYQVRNAAALYLCLFEDWNNPNASSDQMTCYPVAPGLSPFSMHKHQVTALFSGDAAAYYLSPLFFAKRTLGFAVVKYTQPDGYDPIYRNWLKSISTGLEVLRMKNDIQYLMQCQNLSETKDSLTGLKNRNGMERAYPAARSAADKLCFTALRICLFHDEFTDLDKRNKVTSILNAADAVKCFGGTESLCGRTDDHTFVVLMPRKEADKPCCSDQLTALLIRHKAYLQHYGMDSFVCETVEVQPAESFADLYERTCNLLEQRRNEIRQRRTTPNYALMLQMRNLIYRNPTQVPPVSDFCKQYAYSIGHLRVLYKACFGISFHQDCICGKIAMARCLLCCSDRSVSDIAAYCGYHDNKYFFRQFQIVTGLSATRYRAVFQAET